MASLSLATVVSACTSTPREFRRPWRPSPPLPRASRGPHSHESEPPLAPRLESGSCLSPPAATPCISPGTPGPCDAVKKGGGLREVPGEGRAQRLSSQDLCCPCRPVCWPLAVLLRCGLLSSLTTPPLSPGPWAAAPCRVPASVPRPSLCRLTPRARRSTSSSVFPERARRRKLLGGMPRLENFTLPSHFLNYFVGFRIWNSLSLGIWKVLLLPSSFQSGALQLPDLSTA